MIKFLKQKNNKKNKGFTRVVDFGDAPTYRRSALRASPKLTTGFTLIETLVAISIFSISIVALMAVLASGISDINYAKRKMTATYLAQEGIEYVRNIRDNVSLSTDPTGWSNFVADGITGITYSTGPDFTDFTRTISVTPVPSNLDEVIISSKVEWNQPSGTKYVSFSESLFNWFGQ